MNIRSFDSYLAHPTEVLASQVSQDCKDIDHCRTLQNIIYTCFSTIFLCTWVVLHLNVPRYPKNTTPLRRVWFMLGALIAPEAMFVVAFNDWLRGSMMLERLLRRFPDCGWTEVHIQFAQMGGFQLILDDGTPKPLHGDDFINHVLNDAIDVPHISVEEILDRSKSDSIAKGIVVIQTAWFVLQCIHRTAARLTITELEITALGHAITNFVIYWCWWNKPKDVGLAIDVVRKNSTAEKALHTRLNNPIQEPYALLEVANVRTSDDLARNSLPSIRQTDTIRTEIDRPLPPTPPDNSVGAQSDGNLKQNTESLKNLPSPPLTLRTRLGILFENFTIESSVPTRTACITVLFIMASVFGAVHCAAWNSAHFPTSLEKIIWRFASVIVTVTGGCLNIVVNIRHVDVAEEHVAFVRGSTAAAEFPLIVLYCAARLSLLILALLALRALPYDAYVSPSWTSFIPHVS